MHKVATEIKPANINTDRTIYSIKHNKVLIATSLFPPHTNSINQSLHCQMQFDHDQLYPHQPCDNLIEDFFIEE